MWVRAASGCNPERTEVDETTVVSGALVAGIQVLRAANAGKSAAAPEVMCSS